MTRRASGSGYPGTGGKAATMGSPMGPGPAQREEIQGCNSPDPPLSYGSHRASPLNTNETAPHVRHNTPGQTPKGVGVWHGKCRSQILIPPWCKWTRICPPELWKRGPTVPVRLGGVWHCPKELSDVDHPSDLARGGDSSSCGLTSSSIWEERSTTIVGSRLKRGPSSRLSSRTVSSTTPTSRESLIAVWEVSPLT